MELSIAGLALSGVSLALQLIDLGDQLAQRFRNIPKDDDDIYSLSLEVIHESEQLKILASILSKKGKFGLRGSIFDSLNPTAQRSMLGILQHLESVWLDVEEIGKSLHAASHVVAATGTNQQANTDIRGTAAKVDRIRLKSLLKAGCDWNQRLERRIQSYSWLCNDSGISADREIEHLGQIIQDSDARSLGWSRPAQLRQLIIGIDNPHIASEALPIPPALEITNPITGLRLDGDGLSVGFLSRDEVVVELLGRPDPIHTASQNRRVLELAAFLNVSKDKSFRLPPARGYCNFANRGKHGIVFETKSLLDAGQASYQPIKIVQLRHLLGSAIGTQTAGNPVRPSLDDRFGLSYALALAVSKFQSIGWLHQSIRSENVVFASTQNGKIKYGEPWVFGFQTSRKIDAQSIELFDANPIRLLYVHPERRHSLQDSGSSSRLSFTKIHDVFSLGVVLLEIAVWRPVEALVTPESKAPRANATAVHQELMNLAQHPKVAELMGTRFSRVVQLCIGGERQAFQVDSGMDDRDDTMLQWAFQSQVVDILKQILDSLG